MSKESTETLEDGEFWWGGLSVLPKGWKRRPRWLSDEVRHSPGDLVEMDYQYHSAMLWKIDIMRETFMEVNISLKKFVGHGAYIYLGYATSIFKCGESNHFLVSAQGTASANYDQLSGATKVYSIVEEKPLWVYLDPRVFKTLRNAS